MIKKDFLILIGTLLMLFSCQFPKQEVIETEKAFVLDASQFQSFSELVKVVDSLACLDKQIFLSNSSNHYSIKNHCPDMKIDRHHMYVGSINIQEGELYNSVLRYMLNPDNRADMSPKQKPEEVTFMIDLQGATPAKDVYRLIELLAETSEKVAKNNVFETHCNFMIKVKIDFNSIPELEPDNFYQLDTQELIDLGIRYQKLDTTYYPKICRMIYTDSVPKENDISEINYYFSLTESKGFDVTLDSFHLIRNSMTQSLRVSDYYPRNEESLVMSKDYFEFGDYNFDGHKDFRIYSSLSGVTGNLLHQYFLFNSIEGLFSNPSGDFYGNLQSARFDYEREEIVSRGNGGHAGRIFRERTYKCIGFDSLQLIKSVSQDYNDSLGKYLKIVKDYSLDDSVKETIDTIPRI